MSEELGLSIRFIRSLEQKQDGLRRELDGWYIGGGSAGTFSERTEAALKELERIPLPKDATE